MTHAEFLWMCNIEDGSAPAPTLDDYTAAFAWLRQEELRKAAAESLAKHPTYLTGPYSQADVRAGIGETYGAYKTWWITQR